MYLKCMSCTFCTQLCRWFVLGEMCFVPCGKQPSEAVYSALLPMTSCVWGFFSCVQIYECRIYVIVSPQGDITTSNWVPDSVLLSLCWSLPLFPPFSCVISPPFFPFRLSFLPIEGKGRFKLWTKDIRRKSLPEHLKCFSLFSVLQNVIHTQGMVSKETPSSWLKPDNAHGSL